LYRAATVRDWDAFSQPMRTLGSREAIGSRHGKIAVNAEGRGGREGSSVQIVPAREVVVPWLAVFLVGEVQKESYWGWGGTGWRRGRIWLEGFDTSSSLNGWMVGMVEGSVSGRRGRTSIMGASEG
jgi:hypothetical protein